MAQRYLYTPLDNTTEQQIRLVKLLPGNDEPLRIKLTISTLTGLAFNALSYLWGNNAEGLYPIECEGMTIHIAPNLHRFLQLLRQSG